MRFKNKENGKEHELKRVDNCDFWFNNHEELFIVDEPTGYCYQVTALKALQSVLRREIIRKLSEEQHLDALKRIMQERKISERNSPGGAFVPSWPFK